MTTADPPFTFRATGPDIFQVDAGRDHLGTVQKFNSHEWWAYPALSNGGASYTRRTREDAAEALRTHHQATAPAEDHGRRQESV